MGEPDEGEDKDLAADTPETNCAGEAALLDGGEHPGDVVGDSEDDQGIDEAVEASEVGGEPCAEACEACLGGVPDSVNRHKACSFQGGWANEKYPHPSGVKASKIGVAQRFT